MEFDVNKSVEVLSRTPQVLETLLQGLDESWIYNNEGEDSWSPFDVVGHLVHGEKTDWVSRIQIILDEAGKSFTPFNRFAQFEESKGKSLAELLTEFSVLRKNNLEFLTAVRITSDTLLKTGIHPSFGEVTLKQLLATWTAHDLAHIAQICRVMAKQYKLEIGPWIEYMPVMHR